MLDDNAAGRALELYADTVRRICFLHLKSYSDTEDVFQEVFLKYVLRVQPFDSDAHEKAWFIRVTINACKDVLKSFFRKKIISFENMGFEPSYFQDDESELLSSVLKLPDNYRNVIYLHYYEGYSLVETAQILHKSENTIYTWVSRAKKKLREDLCQSQLN